MNDERGRQKAKGERQKVKGERQKAKGERQSWLEGFDLHVLFYSS